MDGSGRAWLFLGLSVLGASTVHAFFEPWPRSGAPDPLHQIGIVVLLYLAIGLIRGVLGRFRFRNANARTFATPCFPTFAITIVIRYFINIQSSGLAGSAVIANIALLATTIGFIGPVEFWDEWSLERVRRTAVKRQS